MGKNTTTNEEKKKKSLKDFKMKLIILCSVSKESFVLWMRSGSCVSKIFSKI